MKRLLIFAVTVILIAALAIAASAAETVICENDFSDSSTLADFEEYGYSWTIKNGGLYMTSTAIDSTADESGYGHVF